MCVLLLVLASPCGMAQTTQCVSQFSPNPAPPYTTWDTAAHTIQEAVDVSREGDTVLVAEGEYPLTAQIRIDKAIVLRSVRGAGQTILDGQWETRCLWISNSFAVVDGFTMTRGHEMEGGALAGGVVMIGGVLSNCIVKRPASPFSEGRLVHCSSGGLITDCHIGENKAFAAKGAGVYLTHSQLRNSTISEMLCTLAYGGADDGAGVYAISSTISGCTFTGNWARRAGGGAYFDGCEVDRCIISSNRSGVHLLTAGLGGGIFATNSVIRNSLIAANFAENGYDSETARAGGLPGVAGGVYLQGGSLINCTVTGNRTQTSTERAGSPKGGGILLENANVRNSILYFNSAPSGANWHDAGGGSFDHTCTTPAPDGVGNFVADPQFVDGTNGNYRLSSTSPCFDAGANEDWMFGATDLDGAPRIYHGTVDPGAWESTNTPPTISDPNKQAVRFTQTRANSGVLRSMIQGLVGHGKIIVESSTDLIEWLPVHTNTITGDTFELVEPIGPGSQRHFFRAVIRN